MELLPDGQHLQLYMCPFSGEAWLYNTTTSEVALLPFAPHWSLDVGADGFAMLVSACEDQEAIWASEVLERPLYADITGRIGWLQEDTTASGRWLVRWADVESTDWELFDLGIEVGDLRAEVPFTVEVKALCKCAGEGLCVAGRRPNPTLGAVVCMCAGAC